MTELREELKVGPDEGAVEYVTRIGEVLERHRLETGERLSAWGTMPGESPGEVLERMKVLKVADSILEAERARRRAKETNGHTPSGATNREKENNVTTDATDEIGRGFRIRSQERDVEQAVSGFEAAKKRLFRGDGSKVYGEEEHEERLAKLTEGLWEKIEAVSAEASKDAEGYDGEALALSYTDPASQVPASDRGRLETSRAFVKEDCESLDPAALTERLTAVSAGSDKVAKVLHARYGRMRMEALRAESDRLHREGRSTGTEAAARERALGEAVSALEVGLEDPKVAKRAAGLKEAAEESRRVARDARRRLSEADGSDAAARKAQRAATARNF